MSGRRVDSDRIGFDRTPTEGGRIGTVADRRVAAARQLTALPHRPRQGAPRGIGRLRQAILGFVAPTLSDPGIMRADRRVVLLESLASDILPRLDDDDGTRSLGIKVVRDEIARQRELLFRLQQEIVA
jgi:hypothetical protein